MCIIEALTSQRFPLVPGTHWHEKPLGDMSGTQAPSFWQVVVVQAESCYKRT